MPPRTRATKSAKSLKENIGTAIKIKPKVINKVTKPTRKVLADKTNSASDENASIEGPKKVTKKNLSPLKDITASSKSKDQTKSLRERRLPNRFTDNHVLNTLCSSKENTETKPIKNSEKINKSNKTKVSDDDNSILIKSNISSQSSFKSPQKVADTSLLAARPRRVCRLPSRFDDHSISPSKFIPVQPSHSSTPLSQKNNKTEKNNENKVAGKIAVTESQTCNENPKVSKQKESTPLNKKVKADTNNNPKGRILRSRKIKDINESSQSTKVNSNQHKNCKTNKAIGKEEPTQDINSTSILKTSNISVNKKASSTKRISDISSSFKEKESSKITVVPKTTTISNINRSYDKKEKKAIYAKDSSSSSLSSPVKTNNRNKPASRVNKSSSFKLLGDNKINESNLDVYEFTYDPKEEPAPQKKKRKVIKKRPAKPKPNTIIYKSKYDDNVNKALSALRSVVSKGNTQNLPSVEQTQPICLPEKPVTELQKTTNENQTIVQRDIASKIIISNQKSPKVNSGLSTKGNNIEIQTNIVINIPPMQTPAPTINTTSNNSIKTGKALEPKRPIRIEDITADFEQDIDYSPVNSPFRPRTPVSQINQHSEMHFDNDPLNLRENPSFFEQNPVASSSMNINTSSRVPQPSPWRAEFECLPIRWHVSSYVKPNMTPAVECSFVNFDDKNRKKHVYTNIVPESNDKLPEIAQKDQSNLVQTSMFSFIKQVLEKSSSKKKRDRSVTPVTASLFNDTKNITPTITSDRVTRSTRQLFTPKKNEGSETTLENQNTSDEKENSKDSSKGKKRKNDEVLEVTPSKCTRNDKEDTYFGFDDSENIDQENVSPKKVDGRKRALRPRARAVLKEINEQGPTRGTIPLAAKTNLNAEVERLYQEMKSASDAPVFPDKEQINTGTTDVVKSVEDVNEDSQTSVHLFEDLEAVVHHLKPQRKSYGKSKKVTFRQSSSDSDVQDEDRPGSDQSEGEDFDDITFNPAVPALDEKKKKKKLTKKQKRSKKEEEEAEAWAAGFNSMCEDVEEFALVIE